MHLCPVFFSLPVWIISITLSSIFFFFFQCLIPSSVIFYLIYCIFCLWCSVQVFFCNVIFLHNSHILFYLLEYMTMFIIAEFFLPVVLRYNWHIALNKFKVYSIMIWLYIYWEMFATINLVNIHHLIGTPKKEKCIFFLWWGLLGFTLLTIFMESI